MNLLWIATYNNVRFYYCFLDQEMDGEAILMAVSSSPGPDCLKSVLPTLGQRLKVYHAIKTAIEHLEVCSLQKYIIIISIWS